MKDSFYFVGAMLFLPLVAFSSDYKDWEVTIWTLRSTESPKTHSVTKTQCLTYVDGISKLKRYPYQLQALCVGPNGEFYAAEAPTTNEVPLQNFKP